MQETHMEDGTVKREFFSTDKGWGSLTLSRSKKATSVRFEIEEGKLTIRRIELPKPSGKVRACTIDGARAKASCETRGDKIVITLSRAIMVKPGAPVGVEIA